MNLLKRIFRSYNAEKGKTLSDWRKRMLAVDENYAFLLQARDNENEQRKNKRVVRVTRTDRQTGKQVTYNAGILAVRDHGSPQEKLRKAFGGKTMRRILKAERRAARENPDALTVVAIGTSAPNWSPPSCRPCAVSATSRSATCSAAASTTSC